MYGTTYLKCTFAYSHNSVAFLNVHVHNCTHC